MKGQKEMGEAMLKLFSKKMCLLASSAFLCAASSLSAWGECDVCDVCDSNRVYIGGFGGGIYSDSTKVYQLGTAFFTEAEGGPLAVYAQGTTKKTSTGFGGLQVGYEWSQPQYCGCSSWTMATAGEIEAFFFSNKRTGHLINPTDRLDEHDFDASFNMKKSVILANAVFSFNTSSLWGLTPYVGGGIGAARICIGSAKSFQVAPPEVGINHFNSKTSDAAWTFAAQFKAGLRYNIYNSFHIFGEYRYLYLDSSRYIFGSTVYPGHAPTSTWNVKVNNIHYNAFVFGIQFDL